jgi:hypothetical protein
MVITAAEAEPHGPVRTFLDLRRARSVFIAAILLGTLTATIGTYETVLPATAGGGRTVLPIWRMLAMVAAATPMVAAQSPLATLEVVMTDRLRRLIRCHLLTTSAGTGLIFLVACSLTLSVPVLAVIARSWLAWTGLALTAGAILGWRLAWTLPAVVAVLLWFWGASDGAYPWWEFSARPYHDPASLALSAALLVLGAAACSVTPWHRALLSRAIKVSKT